MIDDDDDADDDDDDFYKGLLVEEELKLESSVQLAVVPALIFHCSFPPRFICLRSALSSIFTGAR